MKKLFSGLIVFILILSITGCSGEKNKVVDENNRSWKDIINNADGQTVTFYGWGGDSLVNEYMDGYIKPLLSEKYNIKLKRVSMEPNQYLDIISTELSSGSEGSIDSIWINGNNFKLAKENNLLMSKISKKMPNYKYIDKNDDSLLNDFNIPIDDYEVPLGRAQLVMIQNTEKTGNISKVSELKEYLKENPGRFTYPDPKVDFTGSAFVRNMILNIIGDKKFYSIDKEMSDKDIYKIVKPGLDFLKDMKPYLWRKGETYPQSSGNLDNMYSDGEVDFTVSYSPFHASSRVEDGTFSKTSKSFIFENSSLGNTHYMSIPKNAKNKEGALIFINELLSPAAQSKKYDPSGWGDFPVISLDKLNKKDKKSFIEKNIPNYLLTTEELDNVKKKELDSSVSEKIDNLWSKYVLKEK